MNIPQPLHRWRLAPAQAIELQRRLAERVVQRRLRTAPSLVAGGDCAFTRDGRGIIAAWVVWNARRGEVMEESWCRRAVAFPYIPGLLSFREAPALVAAARRLRCEADVFILDGHGRAHPRRFGIACHVGLFLDRPTLGCAKSRLCGEFSPPADRAGASTLLRLNGATVGRVVRTRPGVNPVFISIGHLVTLPDAVRVALSCCTGYRLPEPCRLAHQLVTRLRSRG